MENYENGNQKYVTRGEVQNQAWSLITNSILGLNCVSGKEEIHRNSYLLENKLNTPEVTETIEHANP